MYWRLYPCKPLPTDALYCITDLIFLSNYRDAGIPEMLDVDDMVLVKVPDAKSIMTFLVTIYQHFNN